MQTNVTNNILAYDFEGGDSESERGIKALAIKRSLSVSLPNTKPLKPKKQFKFITDIALKIRWEKYVKKITKKVEHHP